MRKKDKIAAVYSESYLKEHILKSLDLFFQSDKSVEIALDEAFDYKGFTAIRVNDISDNNCMLEFAVMGQMYDVLKLSFLGRAKM